MANRQQRRLQQKALKKGRGGAAPDVAPENAGQALQAAASFMERGEYRQAGTLARRVLEADPGNLDAATALSSIAFALKRYEDARTFAEQAIALGGQSAGHQMNLGSILEALGEAAGAEAAYREAIARDPRYGDPYYNLGNLYLKQGRAADAVRVFDDCMAACGREFHALAYKTHALLDAGDGAGAHRLLDFDAFVKPYRFEAPDGFSNLEDFNAALARYVKTHPTLRGGVMSTENGRHTGELIKAPLGPMEGMVKRIDEAVRWYKTQLPEDPDHPAVRWAPERWRLTAWGVVMHNRGHERPHIHPNGWLSGVFYVQLPDVIQDAARAPEGWLRFGKPTSDLAVRAEMEPRHYKPELGQMFLFPSYFYHGTVPFRSDQRRICIAFDVEPL